MNTTPEKLVTKDPRFRFEKVSTKGTVLASLLAGWKIIHRDMPGEN